MAPLAPEPDGQAPQEGRINACTVKSSDARYNLHFLKAGVYYVKHDPSTKAMPVCSRQILKAGLRLNNHYILTMYLFPGVSYVLLKIIMKLAGSHNMNGFNV